jgi:hypothetical protein
MRWAGHVASMGEKRKVYKVLVAKSVEKKPLGRPRRRWEDGIRIDLKEIGCGGVDWIQMAQNMDLLASFCEFSDESSGSDATEII